MCTGPIANTWMLRGDKNMAAALDEDGFVITDEHMRVPGSRAHQNLNCSMWLPLGSFGASSTECQGPAGWTEYGQLVT